MSKRENFASSDSERMAAANITSNRMNALQNAVQSLAALNKLSLGAGFCDNLQSLEFHILNRTVAFVHYDRAILFSYPPKKILGVSGTSAPDKQSSLMVEWKSFARNMENPQEIQFINSNSFRIAKKTWNGYAKKNNGTKAVWLPLKAGNKEVGALWLERWSGREWTSAELKGCEPLMSSYALAWRYHQLNRSSLSKILAWKRRKFLYLLLTALLIVVSFIPAPLRVVAPCEVVPADPLSITAKIDGVIETIDVERGETVKKDQPLVQFRKEIVLEELKEAKQQVRYSFSDLKRTQVEALRNPGAKAKLDLIKTQIEQEKARLAIAEYNAGQLVIKSPINGVIKIKGEPNDWEGRPVMIGERIMTLINPDSSKVRINLPQDDNIDFDKDTLVKIVLNTESGTTRFGKLIYISRHAENDPQGISGFIAEAEWDVPPDDIRMGVKGSAIIYGEKVPLAYWLLRRPIATIRRYVGF